MSPSSPRLSLVDVVFTAHRRRLLSPPSLGTPQRPRTVCVCPWFVSLDPPTARRFVHRGNATFGVAGCLPPGPLVVSRVTPATSPRLAAGDFGDRGDSRAEGVCSLSLSPLPLSPPPSLSFLPISQWVWELCEFFSGVGSGVRVRLTCVCDCLLCSCVLC